MQIQEYSIGRVVRSFRNRLRARSRRRGQFNDRTTLLRMLPTGSVGAEIGVWKGDFSARLLEVVQPHVLYLVDPWAFRPEFPKRYYGGRFAKSQADMDRICTTVTRRFRDRPAAQIRRMTSSRFFAEMPGHSLDWCYIDGDHGEDPAYADLCGAWKVVRSSGIVCGDDFRLADVQRACTRFCRERGAKLDSIGTQFLIRKP